MPGNQSRPRRASVDAGKTPAGLQLLSPTLQQSIQNTTSKKSSSHPAEHFGWSSTPPADNGSPDQNSPTEDREVSEFNFDGLTLAAVRNSEVFDAARTRVVEKSVAESDFDGLTEAAVRKRADSEVHDAAGVPVDLDRFTLAAVREGTESNATRASTRQSSRTTNTSTRDLQSKGDAEYCAFFYDENVKPNPLSCSSGSTRTTCTNDDFEMSRQRLNSVQVQRRRTSVAGSNRGTFQLSATAAAAGFPMAKKKELTAVIISGWLQKRKGLVLKRWKTYYCLFKSDDTLCLYSSEDTVNGKLEQRYQVLRVVLTDKNDSFHIIGVDAEGEPRREEFRASVSTEWARWFQVLGKFFDSTSMAQALIRKPELTSTKTSNETELSDWVDSEVDQADINDEHRSYFGQRKQSVAAANDSFDGSGSDNPFLNPSAGRANGTKLSDCPMIESSHATVPILENRPSESQLDVELVSGFSWTK
ncbi:Pleckstrin homology-like domain [Phytophthora cinnamomi]|uniref:Pleckstrin homology-like domain n=1 Tax=Phytophthora cinnamomi TaxID=4785 RepID=UPI003559D328|nr:Pleckstrin homology-like domain [Phytophthora cinnamomi]